MQAIDLETRALEFDAARKVRILRPQEIDFDAYLKANDVAQKVRPASEWLDELAAELSAPAAAQCVMPWPKTQSSFQYRPGEVTLYAGGNGGGKSLITGQIALGLIKQQQKVCIASFEMKPKRTLHRMVRQFAGETLDLRGEDFMRGLFVKFNAFAGSEMWLYDQQGTVTSQQVIAVTRYCAVELGVQHMFVDSLMKCVSGEDDYNAQKYFVDELTALARDHGIHIHLIHHIRKLANDELKPNKNDVKGTGAITDQVDNVLIMWRNKKKEHKVQAGNSPGDDPDAMLMCEKQRNGEGEDWFNLWFDPQSQQFLEAPDGRCMTFGPREEF